MMLGRERPPSKTANARTKVFNLEFRYRKASTQQSALRCAQKAKSFEVCTWKKCDGDETRSQFGNDANMEIHVFPYVFFVQALPIICQDQRIARAYTAQSTFLCAFFAHLAQPTYPSNEAIQPTIPVPRIAYWGRDGIKTPGRIPPKKNDHVYIFIQRMQ